MKLVRFCLFWTNSSLIISAVVLPCSYEEDNWIIDNRTCKAFICTVYGKLEVKERGTKVNGISRKDPKGYPQFKDFSDPSTLNMIAKVMWYIPKGLETYFPNLISLKAVQTGLKELKQADLKVFPNLTFLNLQNNQIEVLETDLFKYNPRLKGINLRFNFIKFTDENVFDDLKDLTVLNLGSNDCINDAASNKGKILNGIIKAIRKKCQKFGELEKPEDIIKTGTEKGKYFWILIGCGVIVGVFVVCAVAKIVYGIVRKA